MNIRDLEYVVAVSEEKHFGRAALRCHVSQPALSGQIQKLELYLGVTLFERTNRSVKVTAIGLEIAAQAKVLLRQADTIIATARAAGDPLSGPYKLGMITTVGPFLAPLMLSAIKQALPNIELTLVEGYTVDLERRLADGELDAVILATEPERAGLSKVDLYDEPFLATFAQGHLLAGQTSVTIENLNRFDLLLLSDGHCLRDQVLSVCKAHHGAESANTRETSLETLVSLVAIDKGVTLLPALAWSKSRRNHQGVTVREIKPGGAGRTICLAYRAACTRGELREKLADVICAIVPRDKVSLCRAE